MSLTDEDLAQICDTIGEVLDRKIQPVLSELALLCNDIREVHDLLSDLDKRIVQE